jgi:hypothetical protein
LAFDFSIAAITSAIESPAACSRFGSSTTWYCLSSPPKLLTSTIPGTLRSSGAMCQSSSSSSCITVSCSFSTENWKISPSPDEIGPSSGVP